MREILFRGKVKNTNEWQYGDLRHWTKKSVGIHHQELHTTLRVIPETVGQYTGLTDKNGTKIFEGDVLKNVMRWCDEERNGVVTFKDGAFGFIWYRGEVEMFHAFVSVVNIEYEVIGNIHDNPELLGGADNG